jgi:hypothetical protein
VTRGPLVVIPYRTIDDEYLTGARDRWRRLSGSTTREATRGAVLDAPPCSCKQNGRDQRDNECR